MEAPAALLLIVTGVPHVVWPYELAKLGERLDSVGSKRAWSEVEPADWAVTLARVVGAGLTLVGVAILVTN